nr:MAG TPA: hypothetical protein [Caudoviricetes sp.]
MFKHSEPCRACCRRATSAHTLAPTALSATAQRPAEEHRQPSRTTATTQRYNCMPTYRLDLPKPPGAPWPTAPLSPI